MAEHVVVLGILGIARSVLGLVLGVWLILVARDLGPESYETVRPSAETVEFDRAAFRTIAVASLVLAPLRAIQGALALKRKRFARASGLALAAVDLLNLAIFPVSTALGLYGLVVYRHPTTAEYLGCRRAAADKLTAGSSLRGG